MSHPWHTATPSTAESNTATGAEVEQLVPKRGAKVSCRVVKDIIITKVPQNITVLFKAYIDQPYFWQKL